MSESCAMSRSASIPNYEIPEQDADLWECGKVRLARKGDRFTPDYISKMLAYLQRADESEFFALREIERCFAIALHKRKPHLLPAVQRLVAGGIAVHGKLTWGLARYWPFFLEKRLISLGCRFSPDYD